MSTDARDGCGKAAVLHDLEERTHRAWMVAAPSLVLVRPDGMIAARARRRDIGRLAAHADVRAHPDASGPVADPFAPRSIVAGAAPAA